MHNFSVQCHSENKNELFSALIIPAAEQSVSLYGDEHPSNARVFQRRHQQASRRSSDRNNRQRTTSSSTMGALLSARSHTFNDDPMQRRYSDHAVPGPLSARSHAFNNSPSRTHSFNERNSQRSARNHTFNNGRQEFENRRELFTHNSGGTGSQRLRPNTRSDRTWYNSRSHENVNSYRPLNEPVSSNFLSPGHLPVDRVHSLSSLEDGRSSRAGMVEADAPPSYNEVVSGVDRFPIPEVSRSNEATVLLDRSLHKNISCTCLNAELTLICGTFLKFTLQDFEKVANFSH